MKNKRKILKVRPFNMANFSGGSGYLIFSLFYQAFALLPATLIVWLLTLVKLPKDEDGKIIPEKAGKRFHIITIPLTVIAIIGATIWSASLCYGSIFQYGLEILLVGIAPALSSFFVIRFLHKRIINNKMKVGVAILISLVLVLVITGIIFGICIPLDYVLDSFD